MADLADFRKRMLVLSADVGEGVTKIVRKAALAADQAVVTATPVDTGRARSNWIVSLNSPATTTKPTTGAGAANDAITQGAGEIGRFAETDSAIYITNNLPYIQRLNDGYSKQAPANFVQQAIERGVSAIKGARVLKG